MMSRTVEILLVEDNLRDAELAIRALRESSLANKVCHVRDGEEALDYLFGTGSYAGGTAQGSPRVILLDLKLPKVNGIEVLRRLKKDESTKCTPVVILTSSDEKCDLEECYRLGANSYIVKPVEFDSFMKAVTNLSLYWVVMNRPMK